MTLLNNLFGQGQQLTVTQMSARGVVVFIAAFFLIRMSGRRSFGLHMPLDNIVTIMLGAILSRGVVGASPFLPVFVCCAVIVSLHRGIAWLMVRNKRLSELMEGKKMLVYAQDHFLFENMNAAQVCTEDILQGVRKTVMTENLSEIKSIYIERNGEVSCIKKKNDQG